jgi:tetratricopeptide (TPR) repeat protein
MKAKTRFRLVLLVAVAAAASASLGGYYVYHQRVKAANMVMWHGQGLAAFAAGDYSKTLDLLGNYEPAHEQLTGKGDAEVLYAMARARLHIVEANGNYLRVAKDWLSQVVDLDPSNDEAKRTLLGLYPRLGMAPEAISLADTMLSSNPKDMDALRAKANALFALRKYGKMENSGQPGARESYEQILKLKPMDIESQQMILLIMAQNKATMPKDFSDYAGRLPTGDPAAEIIASSAYLFGHDQKNAEKFAKLAASRPTTDRDVVLLVTHQLDSMGFFKDATEYLQARFTATPANQTRQDWALRLFYLNRFPEVISLLNSFDAAPADADADIMAVKSYTLLRQDHKDEALPLIKVLAGKGDDNPRAGAWARLLDASMMDDDTAFASTAGSATETAKLQERMDTIAAAVSGQLRDSPLALYLYGKAWAQRGFRDKAQALWSEAAVMAAVWADPLVSESRMELDDRSFMKAATLAGRARQRLPDDPDVNVAYVCACAPGVRPGDTVSMNAILDMIAKINTTRPNEPRTLPIKMLFLAGVGRRDDALKVVDTALAIKPPLSETNLINLAKVAAGAQAGLAEKILKAAQDGNAERFSKLSSPEFQMNSDGLTPNLAYARACLWLEQDPEDHGAKGLKFLEDKLTGGRKGDVQWQMTHATYLDLITDKRAAEVWTILADDHPENATAQWHALASPSLIKNLPVRDRILKRLEDNFPDAKDSVKFSRARWYFDTDTTTTPTADRIKAFGRADELLKEYLVGSPGAVIAHLMRAQCAEMLDGLQHPGQAPQLLAAINEYKIAHGLDPGDSNILLQLAGCMIVQGDTGGVPDLLQPLLSKEYPATTAQRFVAAKLLMDVGKSDMSMNLLATLPEPASNDQCRLAAALYQLKGLNDKAEPLVRQMLEHPDPIDVMFAAEFYADTNRPDLAGSTITGRRQFLSGPRRPSRRPNEDSRGDPGSSGRVGPATGACYAAYFAG